MVKIVNGMIVADNDTSAPKETTPFGSSLGSSDFQLNINVCGYVLDKWKIMIVVGISTLLMGFKGLILSSLCLLFMYVMNSKSNSTGGNSSFGGSGRGPQPGRPNIKGINDYPKPKRG